MARRILLADDSVTAQNMGRRILSDAGYEVITVNNGSAALKKVSEQAPDLIVLDVYMPGYGGLEVCQRLKEVAETARIPILLSVGKLEPFKPEEARRVRADAFIVKPFEATELLAALTKLEDKIVPLADAQRNGKGRAAGMAEAGEDTGWKNRLSIPPGGKGRSPEGMEADDFGQSEDSSKKQAAEPKPEIVPAVATPNVAEEVVAKAAEEKSSSARAEEVAPKSEAAVVEKKQEAAESKVVEIASEAPVESKPEKTSAEEKIATPGPVLVSRFGDPETVSDAVAVPATAVSNPPAVSSGPRWVAEEVAASADDVTVTLAHEMEKSLAASAAFDAGHKAASESKEAAVVAASVPAVVEAASSAVVNAEEKTAETKVVEIKAVEAKAAEEKPVSVETVAPAEAPATVAVASEKSEPAEARFSEPQATEAVAQLKQEAYAAAASMGASAEAAVTDARGAAENNTSANDAGNKQQLAAAWEQWQNVRETVLNSPVAEQISEAAAATLNSMLPSQHSADTKADIHAEEATKPSNPTAIASIVDSVLAELKPRLMEEIAKKMGNEKK